MQTYSLVTKSASLFLIVLFFIACSAENSTQDDSGAEHPGKTVYVSNCKVCHAQGINGAPILGNAAMWKKRVEVGEATLVEHATNGFELMPANLGRNDLTQEQIAIAVNYMLSELD